MIANSNITIYHKTFNETSRLEQWTRKNYKNVWLFGGEGATINQGYDPVNRVEVRIPLCENVHKDDFSVGDIIVESSLDINIETQQDLQEYQTYNITNINYNNFGSQPHIHLSGR